MDQLLAMKVFTRVAERASFAQAGDELDISRAAASAHVAALEKHVGVRLLNRTTRRVSLTTEGADYLRRCRRILDEVQDADETLRGSRSRPQGLLRVDAPVTFGRSLLLPVVSANANYSKNTIEGTTTNLITGAVIQGKDEYDITGYGIQLTQPLFRAANFAAYAQGKISVSQADAELAIARQDLVLRAGQAYFDVLAAQDALDFARSEKAAIEGQLKLARRNFEVGNATVVDLHEAQARFDLAAAQEVSADSDLQSKQEALTTLIGRPAGGLARLTSKIGLPKPDPAEPEQWVKAAADQNLQIKVQEFLLAIADEEVNKTHGPASLFICGTLCHFPLWIAIEPP